MYIYIYIYDYICTVYVYSSGLWSAPIMAKPLDQKNLQRHARAAADFASVSQCQKICILYTYDHYYFAYHSLLLAKHFICTVRTKCCWWVVKSILRFCVGSNPLYNEPFSYSVIVWINSHF